MRALICTVGKRDLTLDGKTAAEHGRTIREFGGAAKASYSELKARLDAPIISQVLDYLVDLGQMPHQVVLIASDQPEDSPHHGDDTCTVAGVLGRFLRERYGIQQKSRQFLLRVNPTALDLVVPQLESQLRGWEGDYEWIDLAPTGGTPQMTTGLLLAALEVCPQKVRPLYAPHNGQVRRLDVVRRIRATQIRRDVLAALLHRRFGAAASLLPGDSADVDMSPSTSHIVGAALRSAELRTAFDLNGARRYLVQARDSRGLPEHVREQVEGLQRTLPSADDTVGLLCELYYNANQKLELGEYADFVLRLINFLQGALLYALAAAGVLFEEAGERVARQWLDAEPGLEGYAREYPVTEGAASGIEIRDGRVTGPLLICVVGYLSGTDRLTETVHATGRRLQRLARLRNKSFATHDFQPVNRRLVEESFGGSLDDVRATMRELYTAATGRTLGPDPYAATIELCRQLLTPEP